MKYSWKLFLSFLLMGLLASCAGKQTRASEEVVTEPSDTVETLPVEEFPLVEEKEVIPARVDELFDDFIWNFATNERMQRRRIKFPLQVVTPEGIGQVVQDEWQHDSLFANQSTYTLMFDDESDFDYEGDTSLSAAILEWIYLDSSMRQQYFFGKHKGAWMLDSIALAPLAEVDDEGGFVSFYTRFANDSIYQLDHITNPIEFVTLDPDDEFTILETTLGISQWFSFKPELPKEKLTNINYGQTNDDRSRRKILKVNGSQDGSSIILYFRKRGGEWEMYRFEDTSV